MISPNCFYKAEINCVFLVLMLILSFSIGCEPKKKAALSKNFKSDSEQYEIRSINTNEQNNEFVVIYFVESSYNVGMGHELMVLYSRDSMAQYENHYPPVPLKITRWDDSSINIFVCAFSVHAPTEEGRRELISPSINSKKKLGNYKLIYEEHYENCDSL